MTTNPEAVPSEAFEDWASEEGINNFHFNHCWAAWQAALAIEQPIDMLLFCPKCGVQHIDAPKPEKIDAFDSGADIEYIRKPAWENPPHRSHLCCACGCTWRPADVPTNGVASIATQGKADTWLAASSAAPVASAGVQQVTRRGAYVFRDTGPLETGDAP